MAFKGKTRAEIIAKRGYKPDIKGDDYSLYISSYPVVADHLAKRIGDKDKTLAELCCGIGVTLMHMAPHFKHLIGIDNDKQVLEYCKQNLQDLLKKTKLIHGDVSDPKLIQSLDADIILYDIPFWTPDKKNPYIGQLLDDLKGHVTQDIVIYAPPSYTPALGELQKVFINNEHHVNLIYLGNLIKKKGITEARL